MGSSIISGKLTVTTAGTRQALAGLQVSGGVQTVTIQALSTNEGLVAVGDATVVAAVGTHASPTTVGVLLNPGDSISLDIGDTAGLYLDAINSKDGVSYIALLA